jgi:hypothetical protein
MAATMLPYLKQVLNNADDLKAKDSAMMKLIKDYEESSD